MLNIVIVDNEQKRIDELKALLVSLYPNCKIKEFTDSALAVLDLMSFPVDIVFAECDMKQIDGLAFRDLTRRLRPHARVIIPDDNDAELLTDNDLILIRPLTKEKVVELVNRKIS